MRPFFDTPLYTRGIALFLANLDRRVTSPFGILSGSTTPPFKQIHFSVSHVAFNVAVRFSSSCSWECTQACKDLSCPGKKRMRNFYRPARIRTETRRYALRIGRLVPFVEKNTFHKFKLCDRGKDTRLKTRKYGKKVWKVRISSHESETVWGTFWLLHVKDVL